MGTAITEIDILIRLGLGFAAGAIIGFERSSRHQVAGLRTHVLIAVGATLLMLLSIWIPQQFFGMKSGDPGRIAAQVVSGIGFLGAGAIIRLGNNVKGLTTAASLWLIAAVGLAIGAGMYIAAAAAEFLSLVTLILLNKLERHFFPAARHKMLELHFKHGSHPDIKTANEILSNFRIQSLSMDVRQGMGKTKGTKIRFLLSIPDSADLSKLAKAFKTSGGASRVEIKEKY
ncbi:MAG TPA: magnesium transporter MgtC [Treponema sp.]|nr:magnesium transporter MgtC [Treponema sp.]